MLPFQLPRIAKPSGTLDLKLEPADQWAISTSPDSKAIRNQLAPQVVGELRPGVSTSPDSKAIQNQPAVTAATGWSALFQLPRIAKPSGTWMRKATATVARHQVSTSPDSKAIRNVQAPLEPVPAVPFQLPRIAKPSGTDKLWSHPLGCSGSFNFPG